MFALSSGAVGLASLIKKSPAFAAKLGYNSRKDFFYEVEKIGKNTKKRGWTDNLIGESIDSPSRTVKTVDERWLPGNDAKLNDPATAYYHQSGGYVVRNDLTGQIVQISNRNDLNWKAPWDPQD